MRPIRQEVESPYPRNGTLSPQKQTFHQSLGHPPQRMIPQEKYRVGVSRSTILRGIPSHWTIQCSNGQTNSGTGATNGTKTLSLSGLTNNKLYKVWVNATDRTGSGLYTRRWYTFTYKNN